MSGNPAPLQSLIDDLIRVANANHGAGVTDELRDAFNALAGHPDACDVRPRVASELNRVTSPTGAGMIAIWLGGSVEAGGDPRPSTQPILDTFLRWARTLPSDEDRSGPLPDPETLIGLERLGQALVAHLARYDELRFDLAEDTRLIEELTRASYYSVGAMWVLHALQITFGKLLVIHAEERKGVRLIYDNIANCFHLFTLLQEALVGIMPGTRKYTGDTLKAAHGAPLPDISDDAWWHYGRGDVPQRELRASIWGEMSPEQIPEIDGEQVILLWKPLFGMRSWDGGFFGPYLAASPPRVEVRGVLSSAELDEWWQVLGLPKN